MQGDLKLAQQNFQSVWALEGEILGYKLYIYLRNKIQKELLKNYTHSIYTFWGSFVKMQF